MSIVAIANQKGGCGKTTTAVSLSASISSRGRSVLLVDLDAQAHATLGLGFDPGDLNKTIYEVLIKPEVKLSDVIRKTKVSGLSLAPSNILLSGSEVDMVNIIGRESILTENIRELKDTYSYIFIDCPPSLSLLTVNALTAADSVLIPVQTHYYALEGMRQLFDTIEIVRSRLNHRLSILGILLTLFDRRTRIAQDVMKEVRECFKTMVFKTVINTNVRLSEAPSAGEPITLYAPHSRGARDYQDLADEVIAIG